MENVHVLEFDSKRRTAAVTLFQHDTGQVLEFSAAFPDGLELQFDSGDARIIKGGRAEIPDAFLSSAGSRAAWIQIITEDSETTIYKVAIAIIPRAPKEYMSPEDEQTFRQQIQQILDDTLTIAQSVRDDADAGKFNGAPGPAGKDGAAGKDGVSPTAKVEQTETGAVISVTDADGTSTATVSNGKDGQPGADGEPGKDGVDRSSVYVGDSEPTDPTATLWIDPEGEGGDTSATSRFIVNVKTLDLAGYTVTASNDSGEEYTKEITEDSETVVFSFKNAGIVTIKNSKNANRSAIKCGVYTAPDLAGVEVVITAQSDVVFTASSQNDGNIENLYDGDTATWWGTTSGPSCWLQITSKNGAMLPTLLEMYPRSSWTTRTPSEFVVQGSNDGGKTWEDIKSFNNQKSSLEYIPFDLSDVSNTWYRAVRVLVSSTVGNTTVVNLAEMRLTGFYNPIYTES